jgi:cellulose synthase/poly-beta-1,6-N-acetylglucosamine synthase-like glycosyltransferase
MAHSYVVYPLLLKRMARSKRKNKDYSIQPQVIVLMAVYNGAKVIEEKVKSVFNSQYPAQKIHFIIGSDCSNDGTDEILQELGNSYKQLTYVKFENRTGKIKIINHLFELASTFPNFQDSIIISTDVTAFFHPDCIKELTANFNNYEVGIVGSNIVKREERKDGISGQEKAYYQREIDMKNSEGLIWGSCMGVFGACFASRPGAFTRVPDKFLSDDFFITLAAIEKKYKVFLDVDAKVDMNLPNNSSTEYRRKVRIATGNFQNLFRFIKLLLQFNGTSYAYWSHKVIRWLGPFFILTSILSAYVLRHTHDIYWLAWIIQIILLLVPFINTLLTTMNVHLRFIKFVAHFYHMNLGILIGFIKFMTGVNSSIWEPTKRHE